MAETLTIGLALGNNHAGIAEMRAQLIDTLGANVGAAVSTGFVEVGEGFYQWTYAAFPDEFRGGVKFYSNADAGTILAYVPVNPLELPAATTTDLEVEITEIHVNT